MEGSSHLLGHRYGFVTIYANATEHILRVTIPFPPAELQVHSLCPVKEAHVLSSAPQFHPRLP